MNTPVPPSFLQQLFLLWHLRLLIGLNRGGTRHRWLALAAFGASASPSLVLAIAAFRIMKHPVIAHSAVWGDFVVALILFVTSAIWVIWPALSAGVDDHSEVSRYAAFPISSFRLMLASTLATIFEPRSLVFYGPLLGATAAYVASRPPHSWTLVVFGLMAYVVFNAALSRVGVHIMLNALAQRQSAALLGGGFALTLIASSLIPPVNTQWLLHLNEVGAAAVPDTLLEEAALALGRFPTGWFGNLLHENWHGRLTHAAADFLGMILLTMLALFIAWRLLTHFHRQAARGSANSTRLRRANPFSRTNSVFQTLVLRELLDLWNNPRARLLAAVPFVLGILLKIVSARALFVFFLGPSADAWLMGGLSAYGAIVLASSFSQNAFGYDGLGFSAFVAAPLRLGEVLRAKNVVHGAAGGTMGVLVIVCYLFYFRAGTWLDAGCAILSVLALVPVLLSAGNFLSSLFPKKFHTNLKRRDRLPLSASMLGLAAASLGTTPLAIALKQTVGSGPTVMTIAILAGCAGVAWTLYVLTLTRATRLLERRREFVLQAVSRE